MDNEIDVMFYDEALYVDCEQTKATNATPNIQLATVNTKSEENSGPVEKAVQYTGDKSKTNKLIGYNNSHKITSDLIKNNIVSEYLYNIFRERKTGIYAQQNIYFVELWNKISDGVYKARKLYAVSVIDKVSRDPGATVSFDCNFKGASEFVYGTFNTATKTFTETAQSL